MNKTGKRLVLPVFLLAFAAGLFACTGGPSLTVNTTDDLDDGTCDTAHCSLREAINKVNTMSGTTTIKFNIGGGGPQTIQPDDHLPAINKSVVIDGSTQPGFTSAPLIELDGSHVPQHYDRDGLELNGSGSMVKNLVINRFPGYGIWLHTAKNTRIWGCYIGTDSTGMSAAGNHRDGIYSQGNVVDSNNEIGGGTTGTRNVISGNGGYGMYSDGTGVKVRGNYIGVNAAGTAALGNHGDGVFVRLDYYKDKGEDVVIGGTKAGDRNIISGNKGSGVVIGYINEDDYHLDPPNVVRVEGNYIGTDITGTAGLGNQEDGVRVVTYYTDVVIGGTDPGAMNVISANGQNGIRLNGTSRSDGVYGNRIGTNAAGTAALGNGQNGIQVDGDHHRIGSADDGSGNLISGNGGSGIEILATADAIDVMNNSIGTDATGTAALGNAESGITVSGTNHQIGASGEGNLISGNNGTGVTVKDPMPGIKIQDNKIGTTADGTGALGNKIGIEVISTLLTSSVLIGGSMYGEGNTIGGNLTQGIVLSNNAEVTGNLIGVNGLSSLPNGGNGILIWGDNNRIGTPHFPNSIAHNGGHGVAVISKPGDATGNVIDGNNIWDNGGLGIALGGNSVPPNDKNDPDTGDNMLQNYPVMVLAVHDPIADLTTLTATLDSAPNKQYTVEFFTNTACDPSGYGEGEQMVASVSAGTDSGGHAVFASQYQPSHFIAGSFITATATDPAGNTSVFSKCIPIAEVNAASSPAAMTFAPFADAAEIFYGRGGCTPNAVRIGVEIGDPPEPVSYVLLFVRLFDPQTGEKGAWSEGSNMSALGENRYVYDLLAEDIPEYQDFADAVLQYQFVAYNGAQAEIGRSEVYGDATVKRCGVPGMTG
jgi:CSLREA domain-containing protein